jgi:hypothetical protein
MKQHQFMTSLTEFLMGMFYSHPFDDRSKGWKGWLEDRRPASNGDHTRLLQELSKRFSFVI